MRALPHCVLLALACLGGCASAPAPVTAAPVASAAAPVAPPPRVLALRPPETSVEAIATSFAGKHIAWFESFHGTVRLSFDAPEASRVELHLDMTTLTMGTAGLTRAVRSPTFFDVERFPRADFVSTSVTKTTGEGAYHVIGTLELHGVAKPLSFDLAVVRGDGFTTARTELTFQRHDFGLVFGGPYEKLAHEAITVKIWAQDVAGGGG